MCHHQYLPKENAVYFLSEQMVVRGHLQTDFGTLNVIMTLTFAPPPLTSHWENKILTPK